MFIYISKFYKYFKVYWVNKNDKISMYNYSVAYQLRKYNENFKSLLYQAFYNEKFQTYTNI